MHSELFGSFVDSFLVRCVEVILRVEERSGDDAVDKLEGGFRIFLGVVEVLFREFPLAFESVGRAEIGGGQEDDDSERDSFAWHIFC